MTMKPVAPLKLIDPRTAFVITNPWLFALRVLKGFQANQGLLLAGAVAYYALLSIVPLFILMVMALSHFVDQSALLKIITVALDYAAPGEGPAVTAELKAFLDHTEAVGPVLLVTMVFFASLGFKVLESAISVIFLHRIEQRKRHFLVSLVVLPAGYIFFTGAVLLVGTLLGVDLNRLGEHSVALFGHAWSLSWFSRSGIYLGGVLAEMLLISAIYYFMPVGRLTVHQALVGGVSAGILWEIVRHALAWYLGTLSKVNVVYGSLATAIVVLLSLELAATILLVGAQVIAEYERIETGGAKPEGIRHAGAPH
ncbi:MAG TPA: YihY/virulence factor BrkB family protein [Gallionellaceae bacterium]|nr:YihY/virulence factor BrkB family protein [Gallionellaceae bacterium]